VAVDWRCVAATLIAWPAWVTQSRVDPPSCIIAAVAAAAHRAPHADKRGSTGPASTILAASHSGAGQ